MVEVTKGQVFTEDKPKPKCKGCGASSTRCEVCNDKTFIDDVVNGWHYIECECGHEYKEQCPGGTDEHK